MDARKHYVDNLRLLCVMLLIPFHAAMAFNSFGEGNYVWFYPCAPLSGFAAFISLWHMGLMFILAGISAECSVRKRKVKGFFAERTKKLLFTFALGLFTVAPAMSYCADVFWNGWDDGFFMHYRIFFTRITDFTGYDGGFTPAHLWFLLYLYLASLAVPEVIFLQKRFPPKPEGEAPGMALIYALGFIPVLLKPFINIGGKSLIGYASLFLLGFFVFSREAVICKLACCRWVNLFTFVCAYLVSLILLLQKDRVTPLLTGAVQWLGILTALGFGKRYLDFTGRCTVYLKSVSFGFYIWHYVWLVMFQLYLGARISNVYVLFFGSVTAAFFATFLTVSAFRLLLGKCLSHSRRT